MGRSRTMICIDCFTIMEYEGEGWVADPPAFEHYRFYKCPLCGKSGREIQ
jgi:hypothetical protein